MSSALAQVASTKAPSVTVLIPVIVTSRGLGGAAKLLLVNATSIAQLWKIDVGLNTRMTTVVLLAAAGKETLGLAAQVPL
ncbi:MAG: hypothetical protein Q8L95_13990 [Burkholderiales bacterium]|nr:hypothetical protein [Burkholderiales bacterium]